MARPGALLADIAGRFLHPLAHLRTFGLTLMIAALFGMTYLVLFTLTALGTGGRAHATSTGNTRSP